MDMEKQMQLIRAGNFKENNGSVMRTINMLRYQYHKLKSVEYALPDITKGEITDSVNYLYEAGYIHLRTVLSKEPSTLADSDFDDLEALSRYKNDPRHVAVSTLCKSIRESRGAIDYEL